MAVPAVGSGTAAQFPVVVAMGAATALLAVRAIGCVGAVVGRAIYEGRLNLADAIRLVRGA